MPTLRRCRRCPTLIPPDSYRGLCDQCRRAWDRERGGREERGYGREHRAERASVQRRIDAGQVVTCWRCGVQLVGREWHLDHGTDRKTYRGPACGPCNLHLAGLSAH